MYRNKFKAALWSQLLASLVLFFTLLAAAHSQPEQTRISLLLGDSTTRQALAVIRDLQRDYPALSGVQLRVHSSTKISEEDRTFIRNADLLVVQVVGRQLIDQIHNEIQQALSADATVLAYGGSINDDDLASGLLTDARLATYFSTASPANLRNGILHLLSYAGYDFEPAPAEQIPARGVYDVHSGRWHQNFDEFLPDYKLHKPGRPWVGLVVYRSNIVDGTTSHIRSVINELEQRDLNVMTVFGYPPENAIELFLDNNTQSRVNAVIAAGMNIGVNPDTLIPLLQKLDVPVINAMSLFSMNAQQWQDSAVGMDIMERSWQLAMPEMAGLIQPTVFASREVVTDEESGLQYVEERAIPERVQMLARRVERWLTLQQKPNADKRILLQYFNFPPGRDAIGASYLNVVPQSLWQVMQRLAAEGYDLSDMPANPDLLQQDVTTYGANLPPWEQDSIVQMAESGRVVLLPLNTYQQWFEELPSTAKDAVVQSWGNPAESDGMIYTDAQGQRHFVLPVLRYGNIILAPQPSRGTNEDPDKLYHDIQFPPPHQYIAFYLWLHKEFSADAMLQFGSHGTHEWLPGKEAGMAEDDAPEYLIQDLPNLYAFIMDNTGEGTIAMRRGMAIMITHLTPPFDRAGLNPELRALEAKLNDYTVAAQQSPLLAEQHLNDIREMTERMGLLEDLSLHMEGDGHIHTHQHSVSETDEVIDALHHYLEELAGRITPMGMHTLGVAPSEEKIQATAEAIVSIDPELSGSARDQRIEELKNLIRESAERELDAVVRGFSGRYIAAGVGGDPLRTPEALPTGRNFASFDPRRIPDRSSYALGAKLADELIQSWREQHGEYPDKLTFTLWGVETMRHQGVQESQIMALMGVQPVYDAAGVVRGVEAIPQQQLGRPRIDVTVIPSGLYRDLFSNVVSLLDQAVSVALEQDEPDNYVRYNMLQTQEQLTQQGVDPALAARMAAVRLFSVPPGAYGTAIENIVDRSDSWDDEQQIADVYFMRMSHMYGQGFWGETGSDDADNVIGRQLLRSALSGTDMTIHARSSHVFQVLDGDDPFASFGGLSLAIRSVDGATPPVMISNLADPGNSRQETLERFMGREMRSRYLNPEWISAMQEEGYAGAKFINDVVQNLWGWQVTVPDAVDAAKWNEIYATYIQDRYDLDIEEFFRDAGNLEALHALMSRMLEAVRKDYWQADADVVADLGERVRELSEELLMVCENNQCDEPLLEKLVQADLVPAPGMPAAVAAGASLQPVQGFELVEVSRTLTSTQADGISRLTPWLVLLILLGSFGWGFMRRVPD